MFTTYETEGHVSQGYQILYLGICEQAAVSLNLAFMLS